MAVAKVVVEETGVESKAELEAFFRNAKRAAEDRVGFKLSRVTDERWVDAETGLYAGSVTYAPRKNAKV